MSRSGSFLSGIILAAGASTRMGRPKQLLPVGPRSMLQRVVDEAAASRLDELVVVLGHRSQEIRGSLRLPARRPCRIVVNDRWEEGQSRSLVAGLRAVRPEADAVAILLADQPSVTAGRIDRVASAFLEAEAPAVRPVHHGPAGERVPGHPVFLARSTWAELARLTGDRGARDLLRGRKEWIFELPMAWPPPPDIDTPEDLRRIRNLLDSD